MTKTSRQQNALGTGNSCAWTYEENSWGDGIWQTACGEGFSFIDDGPRENKIRFCPYCGKLFKAKAVPA